MTQMFWASPKLRVTTFKYERGPALIQIRAEPQEQHPPPGFATSFAFFFFCNLNIMTY